MKIELLSETQIKITLTKLDMDSFEVTYDELDYQNNKTRDIIEDLLLHANLVTGFSTASGKLFVEVFPTDDAGCIFYISSLDRKPQSNSAEGKRGEYPEPVIYRFAELDSLLRAAPILFKRWGHRIYKSSLYLLEGKYLLLLYPLLAAEQHMVGFLKEYAEFFGKGELRAAFLSEHAQPLITGRALEELNRYFAPASF